MAKSSKYADKRNSSGNPEVRPPEALNLKQAHYIKQLKANPIVVAIGPPGTSKSFIPSALGAYWLHSKEIERVVIARSPDGPGKGIGHLPGTLEEKVGPYMIPVIEAMESVIGKAKFEYFHKKGMIEFCHLQAIKGRTFDNTLVIIDEAEDIDEATMKAIITRIGEGTVFAFNGDIAQKNLRGKSGLGLVLELATVMDIEVPVIEFTVDEIVRSGVCKSVVEGLIKLGHY